MTDMIKIDRTLKHKQGSKEFGIEILWPGMVQPNKGDTGIGAIGRIDHASVLPGKVIGMHPHKDDEILTYIRDGFMLHKDTVGNEEVISKSRLMLMNAGHTFQHEEKILGDKNEVMGCLQIFVRPSEQGLEPKVQFHEFDSADSENTWRIIAGPSQAPLIFRAPAWLHDVRLTSGKKLALPPIPVNNVSRLLYVYNGSVLIAGVHLNTGESVLINKDEQYNVIAKENTDLVLFTTDPQAKTYRGGMFSGNMLAYQSHSN